MVTREPEPPDPELLAEPEFDHVLECVFGIHAHERRTLGALKVLPGSTVEELASELDRDRSNVNRSLASVRSKGLVERERRLLDGGGYVYQYYVADTEAIRDRMHEALNDWTDRVHEAIEAFELEEESPV